jgi:hypothetical protein
VQDKLQKLSAEIVGGSTGMADTFMREEVARWAKVIKEAHVNLQ